MKEEVIKIYTCEFCGKYYKSKYHGSRHEKYCSKNPINIHSCTGCEHFDFEEIKDEDGNILYKTDFYCNEKGQSMHSYVAERKKFVIKDGDFWMSNSSIIGNYTIRMPTECDSFKSL